MSTFPPLPESPSPTGSGRLEISLSLEGSSCAALEVQRSLIGSGIGEASIMEIQGPLPDGCWPALGPALLALREERAASGGVVHISLSRPYAAYKLLDLPALIQADLQQMLERGVDRFFPVSDGADAWVGFRRRGRADRHHLRVEAAVTSATLVREVDAACRTAGLRLGSVEVSCVALARGICRIVKGAARGRCAVFVLTPAEASLLLLHRGRIRAVRSTPRRGEMDPEWVGETVREWLETADPEWWNASMVAIVAPEEFGAAAAAAWPQGDQKLHHIAEPSALALAAYGASLVHPEKAFFLTESRRSGKRRKERRAGALQAILLAVLVVLCAHLYLGLQRGRAQEIRAHRARIHPAVVQALRVRRQITDAQQRVAELKELHDGASQSIVLLDLLSAALPLEAHLTSLRLQGRELGLEGRARSAAALVPVFQSAPWVRSVRLGSPLRRETVAGRSWEHFSLALRIAPPDSLTPRVHR